MRPITVTAGPFTAAAANNIATSQSPGTAAITLNGALAANGVATLDKPRRVIITSGGNDSGITFLITGTNVSGNPISEKLKGGNAVASASSVMDYATISSIVPSAAIAGTVTVGTTATATVASSAWIRLDDWAAAQAALQVDIAGTINVTVEQSSDDPNNVSPLPVTAPSAMVWLQNTSLVSITSSQSTSYLAAPLWLRLTVNSFTAGAGNSATLIVNQFYGAGPRV